jgi:drug/metabolite transporter (DMT)-like permease
VTGRAWALFALMSVVWGVPYLLIKIAVEDLSPAAVAFGQVAVAALVLLPLAARAGALRGLAARRRPIVVVAMVGIAAPFLLISAGEQYIASSLTGLLIAAEPLILAGIAMRLHPAERVGRARLAGMLLGFLGVALLLGVEIGGDRAELTGAALVLLAAVLYAVGTLRMGRDLSDAPPLGVAAATAGLT